MGKKWGPRGVESLEDAEGEETGDGNRLSSSTTRETLNHLENVEESLVGIVGIVLRTRTRFDNAYIRQVHE